MYLLDTNILTAIYNNNSKVFTALDQVQDPRIATTIVTKVEMLRGRIDFLLKAEQGDSLIRAQAFFKETERLLNEIEVIPFDIAAIEIFDKLRQQSSIRKMGRGDLLIASIAIANRATLVTRNLKDFQRIPNLKLVNWLN